MLHLLSRFITILQYIHIFYSRYVLVCRNDKLDFSCPFRGLKIFKILPPNAIECEPSTPPSKYQTFRHVTSLYNVNVNTLASKESTRVEACQLYRVLMSH